MALVNEGLKSIYTITVIEDFKELKNKMLTPIGVRTMGFYFDKKTAVEVVENNETDLNETIYDYAIIERVQEGLYNCTNERTFYKFNYETREYEEIEEPEGFKNIIGFSIG